MSSLMSFLTSKEIIFVYILAGFACFVCTIVYLVERNNKKLRKKHNTRELNKLVEQIVEELNEEEARINYETPVLEAVELIEDTSKAKDEPMVVAPISVKEDNSLEPIIEKQKQQEIEELEMDDGLEYTSCEPDQETAKLELRKLEEELAREAKLEEERKRLEAERIYAYKQEQERLRIEAENLRIRQEEQERLRQESIEKEREERIKQEEQKRLEVQSIQSPQVQNIELTSFEEEQERTAIISLDELLKKSKEMYESNEITQYADEGNEPISLQDLELIMEKQESQTDEPYIIANVVDDSDIESELRVEVIDKQIAESMQKMDYKSLFDEKAKEETKKSAFKSSPIISPIYGIENENDNSLELENTANYEKLDEQIKKSNQFMVSLKELQENLE